MVLHDSIVRQVESLVHVPNECLSLPEWEKIIGQWKSLAHDEAHYDPVQSVTPGQLEIKEDGTARVCFPQNGYILYLMGS